MGKFQEFCKELENKIINSYEQGVTPQDAENLAGEFLYAQICVSGELKKADLSSRMRKSGVKAARATAYLQEINKTEKKPTETYLASVIDLNDLVNTEQDGFDRSEVDRAELDRLYDIFGNAHVHFRTIAKGRFDG